MTDSTSIIELKSTNNLLTIDEATSMLKISRQTFWRLRKQYPDIFKPIGKGKLVRFAPDSVAKYIAHITTEEKA